jgi:hypothetical protein
MQVRACQYMRGEGSIDSPIYWSAAEELEHESSSRERKSSGSSNKSHRSQTARCGRRRQEGHRMSTNVEAERRRERREEKRLARARNPSVVTPPPSSPGYMVRELIPIKDEGNFTGVRNLNGRPEVYVSGSFMEMSSVDMSVPCPRDESPDAEDPRVL